MTLKSVEDRELLLDEAPTVLHGGEKSVSSAIAVGLADIVEDLPGVGKELLQTDLRSGGSFANDLLLSRNRVDVCSASRYTVLVARSRNSNPPVGRYIRQQIIPVGMSVTEAARRLGVGRPALSNLVNDRAALSPNMALRLEVTFGADRARLLELQAASDRERRSVEDRAVAVGIYAPSFLTITARQIKEWASGSIQARDRLPVLLRRLIHATGRQLREVKFPGYDNAQRHGWDGRVEADAATLWVPEGRSGWELSVNKRPKVKADEDYQTRLKALSREERARCSFVFVTPRNWPGKDAWVRGKEVAGDWRAVRALDASDLEQWLESTIAPRIWLANELGIPTEGFQALDRFWNRWAGASYPPMTPRIFESSVAAHQAAFTEWLDQNPPGRPFIVAGDSRKEAVAFAACLFCRSAPDSARDHAVVFESASTLRKLADSRSPFIPIVYSDETEREIAAEYRGRHCVVARRRSGVDRKPDAAVARPGHTAFEQALAAMGVTEQRVHQLERDSGRSPTVLRRRLSEIPAVRTPSWAEDREVARRLVPMALAGSWHKGSPADCEVLATLAARDYDTVEEDLADLLQRDDSPVWCVAQFRGVVSKIDSVFTLQSWITDKDIAGFRQTAQDVLSKPDPASDQNSDALRNGVCDTLVMLSVHGNTLFRERLGIDVATDMAALVMRLLTPLTSDRLRWHDDYLPAYAEAAPKEFLDLLEDDLRQPGPVLRALLKPADPGVFDNPARSGVLWSLERLAWSPQTFPRVVNILAQLSQTKIDDNWANKPMDSLAGVFRAWLPQTAAPLGRRIGALKGLCKHFPDIGWHICKQQFDRRQQGAFLSARPQWRADAADAGHAVSPEERDEFVRRALDLAIGWPAHDHETLGDLVECLDGMPDERDRSSVWNAVDDWSRAETDETARAALREKIRRDVLGLALGRRTDHDHRAREAWERLASPDPVRRHAWLFAGPWLAHSRSELDDDLDAGGRETRIDELRAEAMREIWSVQGLEGALALLTDGDGRTVGEYAARCATEPDAAVETLRACLSTAAESSLELDVFLDGFIRCIDEGIRATVLSAVAGTATVDQMVRVFKCAPFGNGTWRLLDQQAARVQDRYWREVSPTVGPFAETETATLIDRLLKAGRPGEVFSAVRFEWDRVETSRLKRLLSAIVKVDPDQALKFGIESWSLSRALDSLDGRPSVTKGEMAELEFSFIRALDRSKRGVPHIERMVTESPAAFVQAVALLSGREDDGQDPREWQVDDAERRDELAMAAYRLLENVKRVPGTDSQGRVDLDVLSRWTADARRLFRQHGRVAIGDERIGRLLSRSPFDADGSWPCRPVCEVLQTAARSDMVRGFENGVYVARGVVSRSLDEGGAQERELSRKYRSWVERWASEFPDVASILERIASGYDREAEREDADVLVRDRL